MTDISELPQNDNALAGEYVLGLMTPAEASAFSARLKNDPALRSLVLEWQESFVALTDDIAPVTPPSRVYRRIDSRLFSGSRTPGWLIAGIPTLLAASLAVLLLVQPATLTGPQPPANPVYHADLAADDGSLLIAAGYDGETGELYVISYASPDPEHDHELWLIAGNDAPISMGLVPANTTARLPVDPELARRLAGGTLALSVEPPGGSPTGAPTGPVVAVGAVATL